MLVSCLPGDLVDAYRATRYRVFDVSPFDLIVDQPSDALAGLYGRHGCECAAFLTAWNPEGRELVLAANRLAHGQLLSCVSPLSVRVVEGFGEDPSGSWPGEESLLALGLPLALARTLGEQFQQNAIVWAGPDSVPRLIPLR